MTTTKMDEHLNQWLRDAHAMESQAETMLSGQANRLDNYPELRSRIERHIEETRAQKARLEACMDRRGVSASGFKDVAGKFAATMQAVGGSVMGDEVIKGASAGYAFEHLEISAYRVLSAAAQTAGDMETARVADEICREEEAMAQDLAQLLPQATRTFLQRSEADMAEAKR